MPAVSIVFGLLLMGLSGWFYLDSKAPTALIPAGIGGLLVIFGLVGLKERFLKHAMHGAAAVGLLSFLATAFMGWPKLINMYQGAEIERPNAVYLQSITAAVSLVFVILCVNSFIQARRRRAAREAGTGVG